MKGQANGSHVTLENMLQRHVILFDLIYGLVELGEAQPCLVVLVVHSQRVLKVLLGLVESAHPKEVVAY